ncbi:hypothetical protein BJX76DRAFT_351693 [Aspergillus varians]
MTEANMPCNVSGWGDDPMDPGLGFSLDPNAASDEELWYGSHFGMNSFDLPQWQPVEANQAGYEFTSPASGKMPSQRLSPIPTGTFPSGLDKIFQRFDTPQADNSVPYSLDDLLRTASQLATERALYMNIPPANPQSPAAAAVFHSSPAAEPAISSPSASPSHHSNASDTDEHDVPAFEFPQVYQLPEGNGSANGNAANGHFSPLHHENHLTPLEMPDGTTRFTANWLPVDPQGGFTIRPPAHHHHHHHHQQYLDPGVTLDYQDHGHNSYSYRNAFISLESLDGRNEAGV